MGSNERTSGTKEGVAVALRVQPGFVTKALFSVLALLLLLELLIAYGHLQLRRPWTALSILFDMDREGNMPALFNMLLFLMASLLFFFRSRGEEGRARRPWVLMALITFFLGVDEGSQIHERFMIVTLRLLGGGEVKVGEMGWLFNAWIVPYGIAALALLALLVPWFLRLPSRTRNGFLLAGVIYIGGAVIMEALSGKMAEQLLVNGLNVTPVGIPCDIYLRDTCFLHGNLQYVMMCAVEETLEMTGVIVCIRTILVSLGSHGTSVLVNFTGAQKAVQ